MRHVIRKTTLRNILCSSILLTTAEASAASRRKHATEKSNQHANLSSAIAILDVYPFEEKNRALRCTAFHLGDGYMATSGHCFLGAFDCNGAKVRWANSQSVSHCKKVLFSNASEALYRGNEISTDLAIFAVDNPPQAKFSLSSSKASFEQGSSYEVHGLNVKLRSGRPMSQFTNSCQLVTGPITNIFGQPKTLDTAIHDCPMGEFSDGSPILDATTKALLAIHQASSLIPIFESSGDSSAQLKSVNYAKTISDPDIIRIINSEPMHPTNIRIGGFSSEVFNTGFYEKIVMKIATLEARDNSETISFTAHNGIDSLIEVTGADGGKMVFSGPRRAGFEQRFQFKAPVSIMLKSAHTGIAPSAWIENIQSP